MPSETAGRPGSGTSGGTVVEGRRAELSALEGLVDRLAGGTGGVVLVEGEAGIGKTRLLETGAVAPARAAGIPVLVGRVYEMTAGRPFGLVADLFRDTPAPELRELLGPTEAAAGSPGAFVYRIADAVRALATELTDAGPVLMAAEDVHDADGGSLLALHELVRQAGESPLLLLVTRRPHPRSDALLRFLGSVDDAGTERIRLGPLPPEDVEAMVETALGARPGARLLELVGRAAGNPLFVSELLAALDQESVLEDAAGTIELDAPVMPASLASTVLRRLRVLDSGCRSLLRDAAVLGSAFMVDDLATVREDDAVAVAEGLAAAFDAGFLVDDGRRAAFRHALVRDAIYEDIAAAVRVTLHRRAGRRLAAAGAAASDVAHHLALGASPGDLEAVEWLERAALEAAPRSPTLAVERLRRALSLTPAGHPAGRRMLVTLMRSLLWSGRLDDAAETAQRVLALPAAPGEEAEARYVLGRVLVYRGQLGASVEQVEMALRDGVAEGQLRAQLLADLALRRGLRGDLDGADDAARRALVAGQELDDHLTVCTARCALAWDAALRGESEAALAFAGRAVRSPVGSDAVEPFQSRLYLGFARLHAGDLTGARQVLEEASTYMAELGAGWGSTLAGSLLALVEWLAGDWDRAVDHASRALSAADSGAARTWLPLGCAAGALVAVSRDELETAERFVAVGAEQVAAGGGVHVGAGLLGQARANLIAARGADDEAGEVRSSALRADLDFGAVSHLPLHVLDLPRHVLETMEPTLVAQLLEQLDRLTTAGGRPSASAAAARLRSLDGGGRLDADVEALERTELVYHRARLAEDAAVTSAGSGRTNDAGELAELALVTYGDLGAVRDQDRCRARLRDVGLTTGARGRRGRPDTGWESLTPTEVRNARLVAEGLSNPQIAERLYVSRRTVESHVSSALDKLGVSSRTELALLVIEHDGGDDRSP